MRTEVSPPIAVLAAWAWLERRVPWLTRTAYCWFPSCVAFAVVYYRAWRPVLGWDEAATWEASQRSVGELFQLAGNIDAVLLPYYLFMHYWVMAFGDSETMLRAPSILAMTAGVGATAVLARQLFSRRVGLLAGLLLAAMPSVTRYGQEARPYGIALLLATTATLLLLWSWRKPSWRRWTVYGVAVALLGLFQLMGLLLVLPHAAMVTHRVWREMAPRPSGLEAVRRVVGAVVRPPNLGWAVAAIVGSLPALPLALVGLTQRDEQLWWVPPMTWEAFTELPKTLFWSTAVGWLIVGVVVLVQNQRRAAVGWLVAMAVVPSAVLYVAAFFTPLWLPRYVLYTLVAWCVLAAVAVARSWWRTALLTLLVVAVAIPVHDTLRTPVGSGTEVFLPDHRAAVNVIAGNYREGDGMVFEPDSAWSLRPAVRYYLDESRRPKDVLAVRTARQTHSFKTRECPNVRRCLVGVNRIWVYHAGIHTSALNYFPGPVPGIVSADFYLANQWYVENGTVGLYIRNGQPRV